MDSRIRGNDGWGFINLQVPKGAGELEREGQCCLDQVQVGLRLEEIKLRSDGTVPLVGRILSIIEKQGSLCSGGH
jgi:hypothetical protein